MLHESANGQQRSENIVRLSFVPITVAVIIPVYNGGAMLRQCLQSLAQTRAQSWELIVVDDGSTDSSALTAIEFGARVVATGGTRGPASARNLGTKATNADVVFFIDADVCVYPETVGIVQTAFEEDAELDALIGSYDDSPGSSDFLSQYKNLMHSFVHQQAREQACTFWSGCGAMRRSVFLEHSGFDESYGRPAIEDIELGYRLSSAGRKMVLDRKLLVKHLKKWTFWNLLKTDILDRGIPWTELILRDRNMPNDLNLQLSQRVSVALVYLLLGGALAAAIYYKGYFLTPLFALIFFLLSRYWLEGSQQRSKPVIVTMSLAMAALLLMAYQHHMLSLIPPLVLGYSILALGHRYEGEPSSRRRRLMLVYGFYGVLASISTLTFMRACPCSMPFTLACTMGKVRSVASLGLQPLFLISLLGTIILIALNSQFYVFLAAKRGRWFALAAVPFHLLYHFYNGISFGIGLLRHSFRPAHTNRTAVQLNDEKS